MQRRLGRKKTVSVFLTHVHTCPSHLHTFAQVSSYMFYTAAGDGRPLKFHMFGANPIAGAHFDGTKAHYYRFTGRLNIYAFQSFAFW